MTLPVSGQIDLGQVNTELGINPSTTTISLNDASVKGLAGWTSGSIAMTSLYGKSNSGAGTPWTSRSWPASGFYSPIAYGNSTYSVIYHTGTSAGATKAYTSTDGISWTQAATLSWANRCTSLVFANGIFVAFTTTTTSAASTIIYTSTDGATWTQRALPNACISGKVLNSKIVAYYGAANGYVYDSTDGVTWNSRLVAASMTTLDIDFNNNIYCVMAATSALTSTRDCWTSPDLVTWTKRTAALPVLMMWRAVGSVGGLFLASGYTSAAAATNIYATSSDGATWTQRTLPANSQNPITGAGLSMLNTGTTASAIIYTSADGINWTSRSLPVSQLWGRCWRANDKYFITLNGVSATYATAP